MAISYLDYKKKYGENVQNYQQIAEEQRIATLPVSTKELKKKADASAKTLSSSKTSLNSYLKEKGVTTNDSSTYSTPNIFTVRTQMAKDSASGKSLLNKENTPANLEKKEQENISSYQKAINSSTGKELLNQTKTARNENALAESNYQYQKGIEDYKNASTLGKVGMVASSTLRGAASVLQLDNKRVYEDPNTKTTYKLPSYIEGVDTGVNEYGGGVAKTVNAVGNQMGKVGASALLNSIMPGAGTAAYNTELFTSSYNNTLREGYSGTQALTYATLSTATEFATGKILGAAVGKFQKMGDFESTISNSLRKVLSSEKLNKVVSSAISEGSEEFLQEFIDGFERNLVLGENNDVLSEDTFKNALYSGLIGMLSSGASESIRQTTKGSLTSQIDQIIYDIERSNGGTLSELNKTKIANNVMEQYLSNNGLVNPSEVVNSFITEIKGKTDALMESATKEGLDINSEKGSSLINTLNKLIQDRSYEITFDSSIGKDKNGVNIEGNVIKINPNSSEALEFIAMHEVTHSISTEKMRNLVMDYAEKNPELQKALDSLKKIYKTNDISDEVLADISGQLFGNQEFINMIKNDEPSTFKKLYDGIISIANKITGNTNETLFAKNLQSLWENAYRSSDNNSFEYEKFHLSENAQFEINDALNNPNTDVNSMVKLRDFTPKQLVEAGVSDLPMLVRKGHLRENILTEQEASEKGFAVKKKHYHGLGIETYMNAIDSLDNPIAVYQYTENGGYSTDNFVVLTETKDTKGNNIIVPIEINKKGQYNRLEVDINKIKTVYGKENKSYFSNKVQSSELKEIYNKSAKPSVQSGSFGASSKDNISQSNVEVKSNILPTKYSMQENINDTSWEKARKEAFPSKGTVTYGKDIKTPTKADFENKTILTNAESQELKELRNMPFELSDDEQKRLTYLENKEKQSILPIIPKDPTKASSYEVEKKIKIQSKIKNSIENKSYSAIKEAVKTGQKYLDFNTQEKAKFKDSLQKYAGMTSDELENGKTYREIKNIVSEYVNRDISYIDEDIKQAKKAIKSYQIKVDENIKTNITDYDSFRKLNFGKLTLSNDGYSVDTVWQELCESYPQYFSRDIINEYDMLEELSHFVNKDTTISDSYKLSDEELNDATNRIFNKLIKGSLSQEDIDNMQMELENQAYRRTRKAVQQELVDAMGITEEDLSVGNDINHMDMIRTDPVRLNEKIFGQKVGQKINDATVNVVKHNEAERIRFLNKERDEITALDIKPRSKESAAVQKYGEGRYITKSGAESKYGEAELIAEFPNADTREKIKNAAKIIRSKYDIYIDQINTVIKEMGYEEIPKRKDYFKHFSELNDKLSKLGVPLNPESMKSEVLPTDINGITDEFKPGKNWFASALERKGEKTTYDAITGIDSYLEGASNLIYHTEDIQRYRALSTYIRDTFGRSKGLDKIEEMYNNGDYDKSEYISNKRKRILDIQNNKLSEYSAWLDEQANSLAGKKSKIDRAAERLIGRKVYTVLETAKKQVGSNMTGFNVRSSLTNFASAIQGASKTNKLAFLKGTISTVQNIIHNDGMIDKSDFLTTRFGSDQLSKKWWQNMSNAGQILMSGSDYFTSNQIWRSKYYENIQKGMSEGQAIKNADDFASRIMGDRSKGTTAEVFNSKSLGFFTQFQLEVNNQWSSLIHDNKMDIESGQKAVSGILFQTGQLFAMSYLFNNLMTALTGSSVMFDPIELFKKIFIPDDDDKELDQRAFDVISEVVDQLPFASMFTGGRIPVSEAFTGLTTFMKKATNQKDSYGNEISWNDVKDDVLASGLYWLLPTGYGQIKKTYKGLKMFDPKLPVSGSYTASGNLRYPVEKTPSNIIKAGLFGASANENANDYYDNGYSTLRPKQVQEYKDSGLAIKEYRKYREELAEKETMEEKIKFIAGLKYTTDVKNLFVNNLSDRKEKIDMVDYDKYESYDEWKYAKSNPDNYSIVTQITSYDKYVSYKKEADEIREKSSNKKTDTINYINNLNLSIPQKAIFIKLYYSSFTQYDDEIIKYLNNKDLSYEEKTKILDNLKIK